MGLIVVLLAMSVGSILPMMRAAAVQEAISDIENANLRARRLSLKDNDNMYGVRIDASGEVTVITIITRSHGSTSEGNPYTNEDDIPFLREEVDGSAIIYSGSKDLTSVGEGILEWYYDGFGRLVDGNNRATIVGLDMANALTLDVPFVDNKKMDAVLFPISPSDGDDPGISVRDISGDVRVKFNISTLGTLIDREF